MSATPNLNLPYIMPSQAQKHVTHNEAVRALDALVQISALAGNLAAPPPSPADGSRYIVAPSATGAWAGHDGEVAAWQDGAWAFLTPREGWLVWLAAEDRLVVRTDSAWSDVPAAVNPVAQVGINATADATNRLSVASPATLFNHEGAGHQLKINKALATDTASLLYQTGFSGRAEIGLTGSDALHVKVSADGSVWKDAIVVDAATGQVTTPNTSGLVVNGLLTDRTAAGEFLRIDTTPEAGRGGYEWTGWYQAAPWTNGPAGDTNYIDDVFGFGLNMGGLGVKAVNSKQYMALHFESKYYQNSSQASPDSEFHLEVHDVPGNAHRPISLAMRHDGSVCNFTLGATVLNVTDYAAVQRIKYDFSAATSVVYHDIQTVYNFLVNNAAPHQQRNAANSAYLPLPYYGSDDRLQLNGAFSAIGGTPTTGSFANVHAWVQSSNLAAGGKLLQLITPAITGNTILLEAIGQNTGDSVVNVFNNTNASGANAVLELRTIGASAGDPHIRFNVNGATNWRFGLDNSASDQLAWGTGALGSADKMVLDTSGNLAVTGWIKSASYTVAGVPSASTAGAGAQIFVSNESGGAVMAFSDGTSWRRVTDRAVIS